MHRGIITEPESGHRPSGLSEAGIICTRDTGPPSDVSCMKSHLCAPCAAVSLCVTRPLALRGRAVEFVGDDGRESGVAGNRRGPVLCRSVFSGCNQRLWVMLPGHGKSFGAAEYVTAPGPRPSGCRLCVFPCQAVLSACVCESVHKCVPLWGQWRVGLQF